VEGWTTTRDSGDLGVGVGVGGVLGWLAGPGSHVGMLG
jgi:hypothetical protein